jgi:predicted Zn-dependent protease
MAFLLSRKLGCPGSVRLFRHLNGLDVSRDGAVMDRLAPALLAASVLLAGCGSGVSLGDPPSISAEDRSYAEQQHPHLLAAFGGAYGGDEAPYVTQVGERVASAAGLGEQCTFTLVNTDVVNAFAVPGCYIYVTRGLLALVTSEAELASVLGHEVGHIVGQHSKRQERRSLWRKLGVIAVSLTGSDRLTRLAGQAAQYFGLRYSRTQEYQADDLGVRYLQAAGYDVFAAADMLADLQRQERFVRATNSRDSASSVPEWALSHPLTEHRIERARQEAQRTGLQDDALPENAEAYLLRIDGLLYGDDPEQGFILGQRFAHPVMRISFEAPPGFSLTNSPRAIGLSGPDGVSGEFGGGRLPPGGLRSYAEALASHILGQTAAEVVEATETRINGLPAVLMDIRIAVRGGAVPLAIAVYDGGAGEAYHFILASPPGNPHSAAIAALFRSFRRLSQQEATQLRPRVLRTVRVTTASTAEPFVRRMADPAPRALFELLNGTQDRPLRSGELVKVVTYQEAR